MSMIIDNFLSQYCKACGGHGDLKNFWRAMGLFWSLMNFPAEPLQAITYICECLQHLQLNKQ